MAANDQGFANGDLQQLKSHLLELKHAYSTVPSRRPEDKNNKSQQATYASLSDTNEAIIEKVESDLKALSLSVFTKGEHLSFRLPASKASRDLYSKLKEIRDRDLTGEDISQVHSLLTSFVRELDPEHPFLSAPKEIFLRVGAPDGEDDQPPRQQGKASEDNVNDILESVGIAADAACDLREKDDEVQDPDYQDETMGELGGHMGDGE
ncbi:uncharacterized protein FFB20_14446 [Fusarium fujikuroi]|uniref:Uncharacterized protein n=1 Tax=Gibberella fujikuroi (strain CBS 195.34 / IMI 58289 / NRRL A-6831) TaxID=1279085 RepID=S0E7P4_GIBF5|nr:uncharacterized protein FFUJ_09049 [Fusarium fujikuroi IMI 58289]KLO99182.1 uncharacterized protein Y057_7588 [Fusarium fujikuroi]KLP21978.1 uncharacterized protein LW94_7126 [Fusarium fujikuroi]QGI66647.1 hypothetical protein CEK27_010618 [Fusarium fujikuroi]QGI83885.1 hypothetical protein CEK25_010614 [Fusarium fujikuroi]QGI97537.1 hypothetical protein CEK26_010606 [Fusarium fujikuroi]